MSCWSDMMILAWLIPDVSLIIKVDCGDWPEVSFQCCVSIWDVGMYGHVWHSEGVMSDVLLPHSTLFVQWEQGILQNLSSTVVLPRRLASKSNYSFVSLWGYRLVQPCPAFTCILDFRSWYWHMPEVPFSMHLEMPTQASSPLFFSFFFSLLR